MRKLLPFFFALLVSLAACKKDDPEPTPEKPTPEQVVGEIKEILKDADSISTFIEALEAAGLTEAEVAEGITVFAPLNEDADVNPPQSRAQESASGARLAKAKPSSEPAPVSSAPGAAAEVLATEDEVETNVKDHIVKGLIRFSDLTDGRELTAISGKRLKITRVGNSVWINGVAISTEAASGDGQVVFVVKKPLSNTEPTDEPEPPTASLSVRVWNAAEWSPEQLKGVPAANAHVVLYESQEDYANSEPAYMTEANEEGVATFSGIEPGTYYIEVSLDALSNIFYESDEPEDGVYTGFAAAGIFSTQEEVQASSQPDRALGNFRWRDVNQDGIINASDRVALPFESAELPAGLEAETEILIGYDNNLEDRPMDEEGIMEAVNAARQDLQVLSQLFLVPLDALLSDESDVLPATLLNNSTAGLDNFSFNAGHPAFFQIWMRAYNNIFRLNELEVMIPDIIEVDANLLQAEVRGMRAYIYLQLYSLFRNVPVHFGIEGAPDQDNAQDKVYAYMENELAQVMDILPEQVSDKSQMSGPAAKALLAKLYLLGGEYDKAAQLSDDVINSGQYELAVGNAIFAANSPEILWRAPEIASNAFKDYFFGRSVFPYLRLTEVFLINAEASLRMSQNEQAAAKLSVLLNRAGLPPASPAGALSQVLNDLVKSEMPREGVRFSTLTRWPDLAAGILAPKGFNPGIHLLLPIPQGYLDQWQTMVQNAGY